MKTSEVWRILSILYIIYYACSLIILVLIAFHVVPFTMMQLEVWQVPFLPIIAPLMFFLSSVVHPEPIPMFTWGIFVAIGLFFLYKAIRYLAR